MNWGSGGSAGRARCRGLLPHRLICLEGRLRSGESGRVWRLWRSAEASAWQSKGSAVALLLGGIAVGGWCRLSVMAVAGVEPSVSCCLKSKYDGGLQMMVALGIEATLPS